MNEIFNGDTPASAGERPSPPPRDYPRGPALKDAVEKWRAEVSPGGVGVAEIRLDGNTRHLVPFTTCVEEALVHFVDYDSMRGYVTCNQEGCLLCRVGRKADQRDLLPVYDPLAKGVGVLAVSPSLRPQALKPQLAPVLRRVRANERLLLSIRKEDATSYSVTSCTLPEHADDGADVILRFLERYDAGGVELRSVYPRLSNEELSRVREVGLILTTLGMTP
jgi:hypothetical protein